MISHVILFPSADLANMPVAGIPAAARALGILARMGGAGPVECMVVVEGGWRPDAACLAEARRLAPGVAVEFADYPSVAIPGEYRISRGEDLLLLGSDAPALSGVSAATSPEQCRAKLREAHTRLLAETGKSGDGIVSRYVNRPISRAISSALLRHTWVRPIHATFGTAILGIAMAACLFALGEPGLWLGAILFQAASIFDGVDGEIARATFRASRRGATLDSLVDAATNFAFIAGVSFNLWVAGDQISGAAGFVGLAMLMLGMVLLGIQGRKDTGSVTFDPLKTRLGQDRSRIMQWLTWLTMRDFYAAAFAVLVLVGLSGLMLWLLAIGAAGWLAVVIGTCCRIRAEQEREASSEEISTRFAQGAQAGDAQQAIRP